MIRSRVTQKMNLISLKHRLQSSNSQQTPTDPSPGHCCHGNRLRTDPGRPDQSNTDKIQQLVVLLTGSLQLSTAASAGWCGGGSECCSVFDATAVRVERFTLGAAQDAPSSRTGSRRARSTSCWTAGSSTTAVSRPSGAAGDVIATRRKCGVAECRNEVVGTERRQSASGRRRWDEWFEQSYDRCIQVSK